MKHRYLKIPHKRMVLTENMIKDAISNSQSNAGAARWLGVSYGTYKKYSKIYGLFEQHKNVAGKGIKRKFKKFKYDLQDVFNGKYPKISKRKLKDRIIVEGLMENECSLCGWNEQRIIDDKICLHLDFIDGNVFNFSFENLRLLCPNCYYTNVGNFVKSKIFCQ
tara:strand:+ start:469 stop:960 length:492 start_codon:yes stop_codon:yes gene_type:complete